MTYQFPTNKRFRKLAAKLADAVTVAINSGRKVGNRNGGTCPFGCLFPPRVPRPGCWQGARVLGCTQEEASAFMTAFDGEPRDRYTISEPFYRLGLAYRSRFA